MDTRGGWCRAMFRISNGVTVNKEVPNLRPLNSHHFIDFSHFNSFPH